MRRGETFRWIGACLGQLAAAAALVVASIVDGPAALLLRAVPWLDTAFWPAEGAIRVLGLLAAVELVVRARRTARRHWWRRQRFDRAPGRPFPIPLDQRDADLEILRSMIRISRTYPAPAIRLFGQILLDPARYQVRITDEVRQVDECLRVSVSTTFSSAPDDLAGLREDAVVGTPGASGPGHASTVSTTRPAPGGPTAGGQRTGTASALLTRPAVPQDRRTGPGDPGDPAGRSDNPAGPPADPAGGTQHPPVMLIPMILSTKGAMLDNVETFDGAGDPVPFLSQEDARGVVAHVLRQLFRETFGEAVHAVEERRHDAVLFALLRLVFQAGRVSVADADAYFDRNVAPIRDSADDIALRRLRGVCSFLVRNYVVIAEVLPPDGYAWILRYTKTMPVYGRATSPRGRRRVRLGLAPNTFVIPLNLPFTTTSYHFRMRAGANTYVKVHSVQLAQSGASVDQAAIRDMSDRAYLRVRHRQALPYAHLYARRFDTCRDPADLVMEVVFDEVPPGALGLTSWLAALSALVITLLALLVPNNDGSRISGDVLAFLLAISPVAATFVGYSMEKLQRSSLTTFAGLVATGATSLVAALLYVQPSPGWLLAHPTVPLLGQIRVNLGVFAVGVVGGLVAAYLFFRLRDELHHYVDLLRDVEHPGTGRPGELS
ncbi:hypothetical protein I0C86_06900 [Plantactinospora sp. S1510]|uniref:Uncharacterized protein n=1 Tax=Plantactinospora alkalitolerans TaxID=2789879 RepID=A0ABS0GRK4_9ACTN|nr:hypothetical protein [Plantactinospora alkalitolerans]MBF9128716.1 hypothetical protein [Plantactinospora alkalitolerans]